MMNVWRVVVGVLCLVTPATVVAQGRVVPQSLPTGPKAQDPPVKVSDELKAALDKLLPNLLAALDKEPARIPTPVADVCNGLTQAAPAGRTSSDTKALFDTVTDGASNDLKAYAEANKLDLVHLPADTTTKGTWMLGICATLLADELADPKDPAAAAKGDRDKAKAANIAMRRQLVSTQLALSRLRKWQDALVGANARLTTDAVRTERALAQAEAALDARLAAHGLDRAFSASLFSGVSMGTHGLLVGPATDGSKVPEIDTTATVAMLNVESKQWGWEGENPLDVALRTAVGFRPVSNLASVELTNDEGVVTGREVVAVQQNALVIGLGARVGRPLRHNMEVSVYGGFHGSKLTTEKILLDPNNDKAFQTSPLDRGGRTRWGQEHGLEFRFYDSDLRMLHAEGGMSSPAMSVAIGFRTDSRLRPSGPSDLVPDLGNAPHQRLFVRMFLDAFKVFNPRTIGEAPGALDIGIGFEHDRRWFGLNNRMPSITRIMVRGNLNLLSPKDDKK